jgi:hypothetical protein
MGRIQPVASVLRVRWPAERGRTGLLAWLSPSGRPAHAVAGRMRDTLSTVVTAQWPHARRRFGVAGTVGVEVQVQ